MAEISLVDGAVHVEFRGWRKLLALKSSIDIPLRCVRRASIGPAGLPKFTWRDIRTGGTSVPGMVAMGRFRMGSPRKRAFLELKSSSREVLRLDLEGFPYDFLLVEVDDALNAVALIAGAQGKTVTEARV